MAASIFDSTEPSPEGANGFSGVCKLGLTGRVGKCTRRSFAWMTAILAGVLLISEMLLNPLPLGGDTRNLPSAKNPTSEVGVPLAVPCANKPKIMIAVKLQDSQDFFITPIAFYSDNSYHEIRVDLYGEKGKKEIQNYTEMVRGLRSYTIVRDGADVGKFLVQQVLYQNSGLGCGDSTVAKGKPLYRSNQIISSMKDRNEVFLAGMDMSLKTRADVIVNEIPADLRTLIDAMARDHLRKELTVTLPSNINFATYRMGQLKAYDVNADKRIDFVILEPVVKLFKPELVEIAGESDEISSFMIVSVNGRSIKRIYGAPGFSYSPRYYCVADLDGDGNLEILLEEGFGEAFHFEIYHFIDGNLLKLYSGTEFGC